MMENQTVITDFILVGFPELHQLNYLMGILLLASYLLTLAGNIMIIILVIHDSHLHTPMYFFLGNLSCLEILITTTVVPKQAAEHLGHNGGGVPDLQEGEVLEERVHRRMKIWVQFDHGDDQHIACDG
ncbi:hypothetical protein lerEdw1_016471 [Lerista edwardsae]|nr:hypothetical protein lerEdw1_016471 [Lerista edwardsae]